MVPMAVSLGFGVLFATLITLILVPTSYTILDDLDRAMRSLFGRREAAANAMLGGGAVGEEIGGGVNRPGGLRSLLSGQVTAVVQPRLRRPLGLPSAFNPAPLLPVPARSRPRP